MDRPASHRISVLRGTQDTASPFPPRVRDSHPLRLTFPDHPTSRPLRFRSPSTPISVLTGLGFSAFARHYSQNALFSSGYLDVSVPRVSFHSLCIQLWITGICPVGFPHSDIHDSCGYTHLIVAFRSVSRPSSAFDTQAFTMCPYSLLPAN